MRRIHLSAVGLALGLMAAGARADEVQWRPAPATPARTTAPAVSLQAPVAHAAPAAGIQPASYTDTMSVGPNQVRIKTGDVPQPLPTGPAFKVEGVTTVKPPLSEIPGPAQETWGSAVSTWNGMAGPGGPPGMVPVYGDGGACCGDACGAGACCDDGGWCGWLRNCCLGWFHRGDRCGDCCDQGCFDGCCPPRSCFWVRGEYLLWTVKDGPMPPLVTINSTRGADPNFGTPGTFTAIGGRGDDFNVRSGGRFTLGLGLPCLNDWGFETTYFFLADRNAGGSVASTGSFSVGRPFTEVSPLFTGTNPQRAELVAKDGVVAGRVTVDTRNELWGVEANFRHALCCGCNYHVDFIGGFRYLQMDETLAIREDLTVLSLGGLRPPGLVTVQDSFLTRNEFYGGQVGLDAEWRFGRWFLGGTAKLALGDMHQIVIIDGFTSSTAGGTERGGLLALPTNIGRYSRDTFAIVPELGLKVGYNFTDRLRGFVGYDVLYASSVVRPGDQVDTFVNSSFIPPRGTPVGAPLPRFQFRQTDFWAQGVSFGLEWRY